MNKESKFKDDYGKEWIVKCSGRNKWFLHYEECPYFDECEMKLTDMTTLSTIKQGIREVSPNDSINRKATIDECNKGIICLRDDKT